MIKIHGTEYITCCKPLNVYLLNENATVPVFSTKHAACFDISSAVDITIKPKERVLVSTGLILSIPEGHSVRVHSRSGLSYKKGLMLTNSEGVIDADYIDELFISMYNSSDIDVEIKIGERIAQGELVENVPTVLKRIMEKPTVDSNRTGGFGSTGS